MYRQYFWLCLSLALSGCSAVDPMALAFDTSPFSYASQTKGNAHCATLYANNSFNLLKGKMPVMPGELPTRMMLQIGTAPGTDEISAIKSLESAVRTCRKLRAAAGVPTSATEDILAMRLSKLRYGLFKGDIPYAVYNYGAVQAMRQHNAFLLGAEQAAQKGREIGRQKAGQIAAAQTSALSMSLANYQALPQTQTWSCSATSSTEMLCY